ncbi:hypothetical protein WUBG_15440, partial [Wuchereria bancrofti]
MKVASLNYQWGLLLVVPSWAAQTRRTTAVFCPIPPDAPTFRSHATLYSRVVGASCPLDLEGATCLKESVQAYPALKWSEERARLRCGIHPSLSIKMSNMSARVYVGRLSYRASERDIEHFFRGYGRIRDIVLKNGFGFV